MLTKFRISPDTKFHVIKRSASTSIVVGYLIAAAFVTSVFYGIAYGAGRMPWSSDTMPPSGNSVTAGMRPEDQEETKVLGLIYFVLMFDVIISALSAFSILVCGCSEARSRELVGLMLIQLTLSTVAKIVHAIYFTNSYIDCSNYWYCRLYNESAVSKEFRRVFIQSWCVLGGLGVSLVWTYVSQSIVTKVKFEENVIAGHMWH